MSIDWADIALTGFAVAGSAGAIAIVCSILWWLARQYYRLLGKGYGQVSAPARRHRQQYIGAGACAPAVPLLYDSTLAIPVTISLIFVVIAFPVAAAPAAVVAHAA